MIRKRKRHLVVTFLNVVGIVSCFSVIEASEALVNINLREGRHTFFNRDKSKSFTGVLISYDRVNSRATFRLLGQQRPYSVALGDLAEEHHASITARFQNTAVPYQGRTNLCAGAASLVAVEQALGAKLGGLEEALDISTMLYGASGSDGQILMNDEFIIDCYGLAREDFSPGVEGELRYSIKDGLAKIEQAVIRGDVAIVHVYRRRGAGHAIVISDYRKDASDEEQFLVHDSAAGNTAWRSKSVIIEMASKDDSGKIAANIIDCSQRVTGNLPVDLPVKIELAEAIHESDYCDDLNRALKRYQSKFKQDFIWGSFELVKGSVRAVNVAKNWQGKENKLSAKGLSRIFRSHLLARRRVNVSINTVDGKGMAKFVFSTLVGCDAKGFFFKVDDERLYVLEEDLAARLSQVVPGWRGHKTLSDPQMNLFLAYPRDSRGRAILGSKKVLEK